MPPSFVAFATKVNEVMTGSVTTTGTGLTVGFVEPEVTDPEPEEDDEDEEFDGTEGAGAAGGCVGALKVSGADALLAAPVPIPLVASTVNV